MQRDNVIVLEALQQGCFANGRARRPLLGLQPYFFERNKLAVDVADTLEHRGIRALAWHGSASHVHQLMSHTELL